jgi:hypothetical protein
MSQVEDKQKVLLMNVRLFFPELLVAKSFQNEAGKPKSFGGRFGILKTDTAQLQKIQAGMLAAAQAQSKWNGKVDQIIRQLQAENKLCLTDGDIKPTEGFAGHYILSAKRREEDGRPTLLDRSRNPITDPGTLYSGCFVNVSVRFWAQANNWGNRLNCGLLGVQFFEKGAAFSGAGTASANEFEQYADQPANTFGDAASAAPPSFF